MVSFFRVNETLTSTNTYSIDEVISITTNAINQNKGIFITALNLNVLYLLNNDDRFKNIFSKFHYSTFDGFSAIIWAKLIGFNKSITKVGADGLFKIIFKESEEKKWSVYVLGGTKKTESNFSANVKKHFPKLNIVGHHNGYFSLDEEKYIVQEINKKSPQIVLVGLSVPFEHEWVCRNYSTLKNKIVITCGGYIEQTSKAGISYYPYKWITSFHLNWVYQIYKEPKRLWKRYFINGLWYITFLFKLIICKKSGL